MTNLGSVPRRDFLALFAAASVVRAQTPRSIQLDSVRADVLAYCEAVRDKEGPYGCYRGGIGQRPDLYASCDVAEIRAIMGENLQSTLPEQHRRQWIGHINSYVENRPDRPADGSYFDSHGHSALHANGMVISAFGVLEGRQVQPVRLYGEFSTPEKVAAWLEKIDWSKQWQSSHLFWGGMIPFSFSRSCAPGWKDVVFKWLNANLDPKTGWWRRGTPHADRHQPLGGSVHILPMYQHHRQPFPYPERVIDSVLALQLGNGRWLETPDVHVMNYLELDALYAFEYMRSLVPAYRRSDIAKSVERYVNLVVKYYNDRKAELFTLHPHMVLAVAGTLGLLQRLAPEQVIGSNRWTDIFTDKRFYNTASVEVQG